MERQQKWRYVRCLCSFPSIMDPALSPHICLSLRGGELQTGHQSVFNGLISSPKAHLCSVYYKSQPSVHKTLHEHMHIFSLPLRLLLQLLMFESGICTNISIKLLHVPRPTSFVIRLLMTHQILWLVVVIWFLVLMCYCMVYELI